MLDPQGKASINEQIQKLHSEKDRTILSITHDMEEVAQSEYVIVLKDGKVVLTGSPMEIFAHEKELASMMLDIPFALKVSKELVKEKITDQEVCTLEEVVNQLCQLRSTI